MKYFTLFITKKECNDFVALSKKFLLYNKMDTK